MTVVALRQWTIAILSVLVALASWRFLVFGVELSMPFMAHHLEPRALALFAHIGVAPVALVIMPFQFSARLRGARPRLHRWLGRVYALAILASGVAGLSLAVNSSAGPVAGMGFGLLAVLWLITTARAVWLAMQHRIAEHQVWMIRSAALTFAAVTLRLYLPALAAGFGFDTGYVLVAWLCWVPNLIVAEWWLARRRARPAA
jgi:uncharacterized membrane protein